MTTIDSSAEAYTSIDDLFVELADGVLSVTLNRPDSLNSLTAAMLNGVADALEYAAAIRASRWCGLAVPGGVSVRARGSAKRTTRIPARAARPPMSLTRPTARSGRS